MRMGEATLDDPGWIAEIDAGGMLGLIAGLGDQLREGFRAGIAAWPGGEGSQGPWKSRGEWSGPERSPRFESDQVESIVVSGMGGSGVAGDVLRAAFDGELRCPVVVNKGYTLPGFSGERTLLFAVSFSGNTEETLAAYAEAMARGCGVVTVSTGGRLADLARSDGVPHVSIPDDVPLPRAAIGYLTGALMGFLEGAGMVKAGAQAESTSRLLDRLAVRWGPGRSTEENEAKALAGWLAGRVPVIWGTEGVAQAAALRWKTEFNENAKVPAFHAALPELDHNEIEGWSPRSGEAFGVVVLRHPGEHTRTPARVAASMEAISASGLAMREATGEGASPLEWLFSLIVLGDFVSVYLAILRGVDPSPIPVLMALKERLGR
jgi:glucose/mannose-6-phosphate isomerase